MLSAGPLTPQPATLRRLLQTLAAPDVHPAEVEPAHGSLAAALAAGG